MSACCLTQPWNCSAAQHFSADRIDLSVAAEKADHPLGLLKWLDEPVEQDPVETAIAKADAVLVVVVKGIHRRLPRSGAGSITPCHIGLVGAEQVRDIKGEALG